MEELKLHSPDLIQRNMDRVAELFPSVITEFLGDGGELIRGIDFDLLRQELSDHVVDGPQERYRLDWPGKRKALLAASVPIAKTMRPLREESVNFDTTQNLFIEGDNLDALKLLQESYLGKVKLIYIDPPYNTGNDFVYKDNYAESVGDYLARSGQVDEEGARLVANTEANGRFHSDWLSMMYPRLKLARNILAPAGVLAVSIDDGEHAGLKRILDEIFGERNFLAQLIWNKQHSQQQGVFKRYHEFVLVYARDATQIPYISGGEGIIEAGALKKVSRSNPASDFEFPAGVRFDAPDGKVISGEFGDSERVVVVSGELRCESGRTATPVTLRAGWTQKNQMKSWFSGSETFDTRGQKVIEFYFNGAGKLKCRKERNRITPSTLLPKYGMSSEHTERLTRLMGAPVFDNPKPVPLISDLIKWFTDEGDIVTDFFSGSGTTAEAALAVSAASGQRRRFLLVQLDEPCADGSAAKSNGYHTVASIAVTRIRRAATKIADETDELPAGFDGGFRYLRIDSTNKAEVGRVPVEVVQEQLDLDQESIKPTRTSEDLLFEVLLDWGLELTMAIAREHVDGYEVFRVENDSLVACFDKHVNPALIRHIADLQPLRVVFRDSSFASDADSINAQQMLAEISPRTDIKTV